MTKKSRHPESRMRRLIEAAMKNPTAQADWRTAAAFARLSSGQTSATIAAPAAHSPPIPSAVKKRYRASCHQVSERAAMPVKTA